MRRPRPRPLADLIAPMLGPFLAARGFSDQELLASWPEIVGERLAAYSSPAKVDWPRRDRAEALDRRPDPATLVVRVESAFALELQHLAPIVLERVNAYYGWRCVGRLVLKQGPVARGRRAASRPSAQAASAEGQRRVAAALAGLPGDGLSLALGRLGREVMAKDEAERRVGVPPLPRSS